MAANRVSNIVLEMAGQSEPAFPLGGRTPKLGSQATPELGAKIRTRFTVIILGFWPDKAKLHVERKWITSANTNWWLDSPWWLIRSIGASVA